METEESTVASLPLGEFLLTEDPVWVWDADTRRILWANAAGRSFWGAASVDALRAKRFSLRNKTVERLSTLASQRSGVQEWVETLNFDAVAGRKAVRCYLQGLLVAGGRPGLIVKVLDEAATHSQEGAQPEPRSSRPASTSQPASSRDRAALDAIAARMKKQAATSPARLPRPPTASQPSDDPGQLARDVRELCHEMRNPLSVVIGFAERIRDIAPEGKHRDQLVDYAGDIIESANLAMAILSDFSSRTLCPDEHRPEPEPVEIRAALESSIRMIAPLAQASNVKVYRRTPSGLPPLLIAERILKQILLNLMMNALRHNKTGGQIKLTVRQRKDGTVRLTVSDDGKGMTQKEIRAALGKQRKPQPKAGRSGLGLPLVKRLVESAGGSLDIQSARGSGTTVEILFPPFPARR